MKKIVSMVCLLTLVFPAVVVAKEKIRVVVSVVPQKFFVQQIGGERVEPMVMVAPGASPATYEPKPRQMAALSKAKLYFSIGVPFESKWLAKMAASNPDMRIIHTDDGIQKLEMVSEEHEEEGEDHHEEEDDHGEEDEADHHDHSGLDPHIWLSPPLVKAQALTILKALNEVDPDHQQTYEANFRRFISRVDLLDTELKETFKGKEGSAFVVFHPSWGYFADAYGLKQIAIEVEGKDPKPAVVQDLIHHAREKGIKVVFAQPQFSIKSARLISREIGGEVILADPLAEDWLTNMRRVAATFKEALK